MPKWLNQQDNQAVPTGRTVLNEWQGSNVWDWLGWGGPQCTGRGCNVLQRRLGKFEGPWPACWGPEGRCAGGAAGERTHRWGYAHQPSWPGASEAEWGAESAPLAVAKPGFRGRRPMKAQRNERKYLRTIWVVQWLSYSSWESQVVERPVYFCSCLCPNNTKNVKARAALWRYDLLCHKE